MGNFCSAVLALEFRRVVAASELTGSHECLRWVTSWSTCQGLHDNVQRYRNSPLMHKCVPVECKPAVFDECGTRTEFPAPTRLIPKPRIHGARSNGGNQVCDHANQDIDRQVC